MYTSKILTLMLSALLITSFSFAQESAELVKDVKNTMIKKKPQSSSTVAGFIAASKDHSTLLKALTAAELVETFSGSDAFTVFAPTNAAFDKLPDGILEKLLGASDKTMLQDILKFHVVSGSLSSSDLAKAIEEGKGRAVLSTIAGGTLTASMKDGKVFLTDASGNMAQVTAADAKQSNGIVHVVDTVVLPN